MSTNAGNQEAGGATAVAPATPLNGTLAAGDPTLITKIFYSPLGYEVVLGSRKIRIEQIKKWSMLPRDPKAKQIRDEVVKYIGSQWKNGTRDIIRGLTPDEEQMYLPPILGLKPEHDLWDTRTKEFWLNFRILVPVDNGVEFEAGFKRKRNSLDEVEPIDINGYYSYQFARQNSRVAREGDDNPIIKDFVIIDLAQESLNSIEAFSTKRIVDRLYLKLTFDGEKIESERNKIDWILETRGGAKGVGTSIYGWSYVQKIMELEKIKDKNPDEFKLLVEDRDLESKALLRKAVTFGKVVQEGSTYFYQGINMGNTTKAAITWINDPSNTEYKVVIMQAVRNFEK